MIIMSLIERLTAERDAARAQLISANIKLIDVLVYLLRKAEQAAMNWNRAGT